MRRVAGGILAHANADKTTLREALLYRDGWLKKAGRVDHDDAFLDTDEMKRHQGITIFAKQAMLLLERTMLILLDTSGHVDSAARRSALSRCCTARCWQR